MFYLWTQNSDGQGLPYDENLGETPAVLEKFFHAVMNDEWVRLEWSS
jgi:hypothetical protein